MIQSLDGYVEDETGNFSWGAPDDAELHTYLNELTASVGTHLYGRRMYDTMVFWESAHELPDPPPYIAAWTRMWQAADKIVYSRSLTEPRSKRTRIERAFDVGALRTLKESASTDLTISGPELAAQALRAGLVDELQRITYPIVVGGGKAFLPAGVKLDLRLLDERRCESGVVVLRYAVRG